MIPPFNDHEVLPPFLGDDPTLSNRRSPFITTIEEVVDRFATTERRRLILDGFLNFRAALRAAGIGDCKQWLDGSFVENKAAEPKDVDVITFHLLAPADDALFMSVNRPLVDPRATKAAYLVDAYFVSLLPHNPWQTVFETSYWYGLFSHQRDTERWKGMLQVPLASPDDDANARAMLAGRTP